MGKNANPAAFRAYTDLFEGFIHTGAALSFTETQLYGGLDACKATGLSTTSCNTSRSTDANLNASSSTKVYLEQTWARPDMVEAHKITVADKSTADGAPIVDTGSNGGDAKLYYTSLAGMTADLHAAFFDKAADNPGFAGAVPVGDAFQRAVDEGLVLGSGFYNAQGTYVEPADGTMNLWWLDRTHASKYGSYLSALTLFGTITGLDPQLLGSTEQAAFDLSISAADAVALQRVAAVELGFAAAVPEPASAGLLAAGLAGVLWARRRRMAA